MRRSSPLLVLGALLLAACGGDRPDWRLHALLGGTANYKTVQTPTSIEAYPLAPEPGDSTHDGTWIGPYAVTGAGVDVDPETAATLSRVFLDSETYDWQRVKKMPWAPRIGLRFVRDAEKVDLVLCLDSDQLLVFQGRTLVHYEDTDAARAELVAVTKRLFPDDTYVQGLSPAIE